MATRIVICDDHPLFRGGLAAALAAEPDFEVAAEVGTIDELRAAVAAVGADLLLLDLDLPDGRGEAVVAELVDTVPVVIVSAHDQPDLVRRAVQDGALGFIRKDTDPVELLRLLRRAAEGRTALSGDMAMRLADSLRRPAGERSVDERLASLSPRQREVVALIAQGRTNREIGDVLHISEGTVKNYVTKILEVMEVSDRTKLAVLAVRHGMDR